MTAAKEKQRAVEQEYNEPFWVVVLRFARAGETLTSTAKILGYSYGSFRRLCEHHDMRDIFPRRTESAQHQAWVESLRGRDTETLKRAREKAREVNPTYTRLVVNGVADSMTGHCRRLGLSPYTVRDRLRKGWALEKAFSPYRFSSAPPRRVRAV